MLSALAKPHIPLAVACREQTAVSIIMGGIVQLSVDVNAPSSIHHGSHSDNHPLDAQKVLHTEAYMDRFQSEIFRGKGLNNVNHH